MIRTKRIIEIEDVVSMRGTNDGRIKIELKNKKVYFASGIRIYNGTLFSAFFKK